MFIIYLTGVIGEDGKSWCPDCEAHKDAIQEHVINITPCVVLKANVMERKDWVGVQNHPYKIHPIIKAKGVPSVILC